MKSVPGPSEGTADFPVASLSTITGDEYVFLLVPRPGTESLSCGGYIAESCARGRPPFVAILTDGCGAPSGSNEHSADRTADRLERETRRAMSLLRLPDDRLLFVGLYDHTVPAEGWFFDAVVKALALVMWRHDCNVICSPWQAHARGDHLAAQRMAATVAERTGVGLMWYLPDGCPLVDTRSVAAARSGYRLDISRHLQAKRRALSTHDPHLVPAATAGLSDLHAIPGASADCGGAYEVFLRTS
jgi:LmbE family N-acetylglucosaminyl deacetylase